MNQMKQVHAQIILQGLTNQSLTLGKLIAFCAVNHAGNLEYAQLVFDQLKEPNKFMYNSLIRGYSNSDNNQLVLFNRCIGLLYLFMVMVLNLELVLKTLVSWNSMIGGYSKMGCCKEAFLLFKEMRGLGLELDGFSLVSLLSVCSQNCELNLGSQVGDLVMGKKVHDYVRTNDIIPSVTLHNALIDMYAKCGSLGITMDIFNEMSEKNLVSWNVVIGALALHGRGLRAVELFEEMQAGRNRIWPDEFTFMGLLSACSHSGLVDKGRASRKPAFEIEMIGKLIDVNSQGLIAAGEEASSSNNNNNKADKNFQETKETSQSPKSFRKRSRKGVPFRSPSK
ncbi:hypothetical protein QYF36_024031 [Acer negundo]|nr:hypothetical protein QYF36_024031 [Acer negundo]